MRSIERVEVGCLCFTCMKCSVAFTTHVPCWPHSYALPGTLPSPPPPHLSSWQQGCSTPFPLWYQELFCFFPSPSIVHELCVYPVSFSHLMLCVCGTGNVFCFFFYPPPPFTLANIEELFTKLIWFPFNARPNKASWDEITEVVSVEFDCSELRSSNFQPSAVSLILCLSRAIKQGLGAR